MFTGAASQACNPLLRKCGGCIRCVAEEVLDEAEWYIIVFFQRVQDQYINQTPMGTSDGTVICTPRLEGYEAALRLYEYPREDWAVLIDYATLLTWVYDEREERSSEVPDGSLRDSVPGVDGDGPCRRRVTS